MANDDFPIYSDSEAVYNPLNPNTTVIEERDPLKLDIADDTEFVKRAKRLVKESREFYESEYHLKERQARNEKYLWGRQLDDIKLKDYNARYVDNVIYEAEAYLKPIALSTLPDITVKPGQEDQESKQIAEDLSKVLNSNSQARRRRRTLGMAFKHHPVYYFGAIKYFWNPEKGADGDYEFIFVHPELLTLDHTSPTNNPDDMRFIDEACPYSVKEVVMRFPDKEEDLYKELGNQGVFSPDGKNSKNDAGMSTIIQIHELWFDWPEKVGNKDQYEMVSGVSWYYGDLLLKKMKNPNWDWTGTPQTYTYKISEPDTKGSKTYDKVPASPEQIQNSVLGGEEKLTNETVFHNHFDNPRKPYIFIGYDQWGKVPIDETTRIEQNVYIQMNLDKRGKQITEMLDRARGKHIFSTDSGLKKEDIEELDMADPNTDLLVKGLVAQVHAYIQGEQPSAQMFQDTATLKETMLDKAGVHPSVRGAAQSETTATQTQIAREGDFTRANDLTEDTINYASEEIANAELQMIKLRYTEDHFARLMGKDGKTVFTKINRDMIQDGMEITISASATDKLKAQQNAFDMSKMRMTDPLSFYQDINATDPVGRTEKLLTFMQQPDLYLQKYVLNQSTEDMANTLNGQPQQPGQGGGAQAALLDIQQLEQGQIPPVPTQVDADYVNTIVAFIDSPKFQDLITRSPEIQGPVSDWLTQVQAVAQNSAQNPAQPQPTQQPQVPTANAGPVSGNPQPTDTTKVNSNPPTGVPGNV